MEDFAMELVIVVTAHIIIDSVLWMYRRFRKMGN